jgi:hypothetical protein
MDINGFLGRVREPGDDDYEDARKIWNGTFSAALP